MAKALLAVGQIAGTAAWAWLAALLARLAALALLLHALDLADTHLGTGLGVAQHGLELGTAHGLDTTGSVDGINGHLATQATLGTAVSQTAADGMHQTDFDRLGLGQQQTGRAQCSTGSASLKYQSAGQLGRCGHGKVLS